MTRTLLVETGTMWATKQHAWPKMQIVFNSCTLCVFVCECVFRMQRTQLVANVQLCEAKNLIVSV